MYPLRCARLRSMLGRGLGHAAWWMGGGLGGDVAPVGASRAWGQKPSA